MAASSTVLFLPLLWILPSLCSGAAGYTHNEDEGILRILKSEYWKNTPPSWKGSDPCGSRWDGVLCSDSKIISLVLSSTNLTGTLGSDIGSLSRLESLVLSYNPGLTGPIPRSLGNLSNLNTLILIGCSFKGIIPNELGALHRLQFLDLNSNKLIGPIPPSLGYLRELSWLDLANNHLTGSLPVSRLNGSGLDMLVNAKHFHLHNNKLSGSIPLDIFHLKMQLVHVLLDSNSFEGEFPSTLSLLPDLEIVRLDRNSLEGPIPSTISQMKTLNALYLSNNKLSGPIPDLSGMINLQYVDLSNNQFDMSEAPHWFWSLQSLTNLVIENGKLTGQFPSGVFSLPQIETVSLPNNYFNGTLEMEPDVSPQLQMINLEYNKITDMSPLVITTYNNSLRLQGNPACAQNRLRNSEECQPNKTGAPQGTQSPYETNLTHCQSTCSMGLKPNPHNCECVKPYKGRLVFMSPSFSDLTNASRFRNLEESLWIQLSLSEGAVSICGMFFDERSYLNIDVLLYPSGTKYFTLSKVLNISWALSYQKYLPSEEFVPYYFIADPLEACYFQDISKSKGLRLGTTIGIVVSSAAVFAIAILGTGIYALRQKRKAKKAIQLSQPFAAWETSGKDSGGAPQLKGARWFSYNELKEATNNFSNDNEIGSGGYGKVYKGLLAAGGEMVAIKRAKEESLQGAAEFKNEIELLSRVHHKNLVGLIGFCFEEGEQMLVYEYMPNGTLRDNLHRIHLDWGRRIRIALGVARGLSYLHNHANPPIIHRDVKSSNILLDESLTAKVADLGLSKLVAGGKSYVSTQVKGTLGYVDPEYYMTQQLSQKSDVYSFGVVLMETITARQPIEGGRYIVREVRSSLERGGVKGIERELLDPFLRDSSSALTGFQKFVSLAVRCAEESGASRPDMSEVVKELECIVEDQSESEIFDEMKGSKTHLYPYGNGSSDFFDYSGAYMVPSVVEPK
eukprot:Gb_27827 [translate_table: standard]